MSMKNCGLCQYSVIRPEQGKGLCHNLDADKYAEEVDYHDKECDNFESLSESFIGELWESRQ